MHGREVGWRWGQPARGSDAQIRGASKRKRRAMHPRGAAVRRGTKLNVQAAGIDMAASY
ncbi:hypothetical protein [Vibrio vulnificus]|uniref:hypothetical protein n=1 Tax=Vibrio vulnificus TaxID=672 RepID=UPI0032EE0053